MKTAVIIGFALAVSAAHAQFQIIEDFENYTIGEFPAPEWLDVAENLSIPNAPVPSVLVVETAGPDGTPTKVVETIDAIAGTQGFYRQIPVSSRYIVSADVRVDRFSDNSSVETAVWTWEVGVAKLVEETDFCCVPQVGIYGSSFTGGWRLFVNGVAGTFADIDLNVPIDLDRWYSVEVDIDGERGIIRSRISDATTGECLRDQIDVIKGWTPADGAFDVLNIFESEQSNKDATQSNLCVVDNVSLLAFGRPDCAADLTGCTDPNDACYGVPNGVVDADDFFYYLDRFVEGCG